jgi:hypothetical protein
MPWHMHIKKNYIKKNCGHHFRVISCIYTEPCYRNICCFLNWQMPRVAIKLLSFSILVAWIKSLTRIPWKQVDQKLTIYKNQSWQLLIFSIFFWKSILVKKQNKYFCNMVLYRYMKSLGNDGHNFFLYNFF